MTTQKDHESKTKARWFISYSTFFIVSVLWVGLGKFRDVFGKLTGLSKYLEILSPKETVKDGFDHLIPYEKGFFIRRIYHRMFECFERPLCSQPGGRIDILPRQLTHGGQKYSVDQKLLSRENQIQAKQDGLIKNVLNLASYNYLGFGDNWTETCGSEVFPVLDSHGIISPSTSLEAGFTSIHQELEKFVAKFLHKEDALVFSMGYGTNTTALTSLLSDNSIVISDKLNHTSIVNGCRGSNAKIVPFKHNSISDLERTLKKVILCGRSFPNLPKSEDFEPFDQIVVVVEGIYSMEGETCDLPAIVKLCKKFKAALYVDEAHSIGALGKTGRGICEHQGVDFKDVDVLMGTFSKSFGGMGGYVAGDRNLIQKLRASTSGQTSMSPLATLVAKQVLTAFKIIDQPEGLGQQKIRALKENANYFRKKLRQIGVVVLGDEDSPVIPVMIYTITKLHFFSTEMLKRGVAVVIVGFPATPADEGRVRFCISASHSKEDLRYAAKEVAKVSKLMAIRFEKNYFG